MNPVALVTGGSRGIGRAIAIKLSEKGYHVAVNGTRPVDQTGDLMETINAAGPGGIYCQGDISSRKDHESILEKVRSEWGRLNLLVNNAGVGPRVRNDILIADEEEFDWVMGINLKGPWFLTQSVANWMVQQKEENSEYSGCLVTIGSISATVVSTNRGEYCLSKAGVAMANRLWAARLAEFGIPAYEVRPGITRTDMTSGVTEKYDRLIAEGLTVQQRWGTPEDVAEAVSALAAGSFPYSTGDVFMVDGGLTMQRL